MIRFWAGMILVAASGLALPGGAFAQTTAKVIPAPVEVAKPADKAPPAPPSANPCAPLSMETSTTVSRRLQAFESVFGKKAITWNAEDYDRVIALATSCQGVRVGNGVTVHAPDWIASVNEARKNVMQVAEIARVVDEYARSLQPERIRFPFCDKVLDYGIDPYAQVDNSKEIFGESLMEMGDGDLDRVVKYVNYCIAYLPAYASGSRGWLPERTMDQVHRLMDRALILQKRRDEWATWQKRPTDLVIEVEGVSVPPTLTATGTREMILRFNRATALQRKFTPETVSTLMKLSDDVLTKNVTAFDKLYAEAVRQRLQDEIFRR